MSGVSGGSGTDPLSLEDPTTLQDANAQTRAYEHIASGLAARRPIWMSLPDIRRLDDATGRDFQPV
jgi:hypothetical protein